MTQHIANSWGCCISKWKPQKEGLNTNLKDHWFESETATMYQGLASNTVKPLTTSSILHQKTASLSKITDQGLHKTCTVQQVWNIYKGTVLLYKQ